MRLRMRTIDLQLIRGVHGIIRAGGSQRHGEHGSESGEPVENLYCKSWPIQTSDHGGPPTKLVFDEAGRSAVVCQSIVVEGAIISGIDGSVIGQNVGMHSYCDRGGRNSPHRQI